MAARGESVSIDMLNLRVAYDGPEVLRGVSLRIEPGEQIALLGPSGCGKTTLLRAIAGLEHLAGGSIHLGDQLVSSTTTHLAPERRRVGLVFQDWALFPHLSVAKNVAYGLSRSERADHQRVARTLAMVGLEGLDDRAPHTLSGGQQQRVALARALAPQPNVLLLDEPFSNLDASLRTEIRTEVHRILAELDVTAVFVTHDQDEAFVLGDRVAVMRDGQVVQWGTPAEVYSVPVDPWVARFVGEANLIPGSASEREVATAIGPVPSHEPCHGPVEVLVRPEDLDLAPHGNAAIDLVEYYGHDTTYEVVLNDGQRLRVRQASIPRFGRGDSVSVRFIGTTGVAYPMSAVDRPRTC
jgi:iron(III) transport system ATP-binding protein